MRAARILAVTLLFLLAAPVLAQSAGMAIWSDGGWEYGLRPRNDGIYKRCSWDGYDTWACPTGTEPEPAYWNSDPEPTEADLEAHGQRGKWLWVIHSNTFREAWTGRVVAWVVTDSAERPGNLPGDLKWTDSIGVLRIGMETWGERLIRQRDRKRSYRVAEWLRSKWGWMNNESKGNP